MKGFKSYGNARVSVPLHKGFTCIVGPNGSGKSNLFDAISFVLGRMSAKSMRAGSISDLVFAGTEKHRPAEYSDVSMHFDNKDKVFPIEKDEVVISRKVDKSGKGVYRVNNKRETRAYVVDILNHAGLTPDGYNMISQGDITKFIKMSSFERRSIIEEISGIQEYDEKKEKGLRELSKAEENIARVDLVINEVRSRLERLEQEKNDALRYRYLKEEISKNKGGLIFGELDEQRKELSEVTGDIESNQSEIASLSEEMKRLGEEIGRLEEDAGKKERELEHKSETEQLDISREIASLTSSRDTLVLKEQMKESARATLKRKLGVMLDTLERVSTEMEEGSGQAAGKRAEMDDADHAVESKEKEYASLIEGLGQTREQFFLYKQKSDSLASELQTLRNDEYETGRDLAAYHERVHAAKDKLASAEEELGAIDSDGISGRLGEIDRDLEGKKAERESLTVLSLRDRESAESSELEAVEKKISSLERNGAEMRSRIGRKNEARDRYGRNMSATDKIMQLRDSGEIDGIIGKVSDLATTRKEYAVALEIAAGSRMKDIVVENSDVARQCVHILKSNRLGRVTFIPLDDISPRFTPERYSSNLSKEGVVDFAINLVSFKEEHRKAFEFVFSNTLIINDIDVSKGLSRQRMVTLDGDVVEASGIITGGYWKPKKYLESFETVEDEEALSGIYADIAAFDAKRSSLKEALAETRKAIESASSLDAKLSAEISALVRERRDLSRSLESASQKREALKSRIDAFSKTADELEASISEKDRSLVSIRDKIDEVQAEKEGVDRKVEEYSSEDIERSQELSDEISALRSSRETLSAEIAALDSRMVGLLEKSDSLSSDITETESDIGVLASECKEISGELHGVESQLSQARNKEGALASELQALKSERDAIRADIGRNRSRRESATSLISKCEGDIKVLEVRQATIEQRIAELREESVSYERPDERVEDLRELKFRISRMEKEKEQLEPINMRSIEEYDEVDERYITLSSRKEKLLEEQASILSFIDEIETKKRDIFMQAFLVVKENFSDVFAQLSPEGEGRLVLEDEEDPFAGGLFIEARPAGKELNRTESMSGGEKALTALAFVFAIQQFKPAPFYILDEIDAHLDDDNVKKVSELIKRSSASSQFIAITHRDVMMTTADRLFGTSISKEKISKIVSVELEKVSGLEETSRYGTAGA